MISHFEEKQEQSLEESKKKPFDASSFSEFGHCTLHETNYQNDGRYYNVYLFPAFTEEQLNSVVSKNRDENSFTVETVQENGKELHVLSQYGDEKRM